MLVRLAAAILFSLQAIAAHAEALALTVTKAEIGNDLAPPTRQLSLTLARESAMAFGDFTTRHAGKIIDVRVDGAVVMSPRIVEPILGGMVMVSGMFEPGQLETMADRISSGAAEVEVETQPE